MAWLCHRLTAVGRELFNVDVAFLIAEPYVPRKTSQTVRVTIRFIYRAVNLFFSVPKSIYLLTLKWQYNVAKIKSQPFLASLIL